MVVAQRKYATSQQALDQARHFFDLAGAAEREGQGPHSDALKAEIQVRLQEQAFDAAKLAMEDPRLTLSGLLLPTLSESFIVVDDRVSARPLPRLPEIQAIAL